MLERLALGDLEDLENPARGVGSILNVAEEVDVDPPRCRYKKIPLTDGQPIPVERLIEAVEWVRERIASDRVLVACHYGVGRSASVVIAYLCSVGFGYGEALDFVSSKRPRVDPVPHLEQTIVEILGHPED
ncbi:MAG: dual specificity protein phosphatase family protein [Deltaproteobacteria bacterium]|nr:dual specificity protein phosphatase family protein [Deltaproteobacteria bacterium]